MKKHSIRLILESNGILNNNLEKKGWWKTALDSIKIRWLEVCILVACGAFVTIGLIEAISEVHGTERAVFQMAKTGYCTGDERRCEIAKDIFVTIDDTEQTINKLVLNSIFDKGERVIIAQSLKTVINGGEIPSKYKIEGVPPLQIALAISLAFLYFGIVLITTKWWVEKKSYEKCEAEIEELLGKDDYELLDAVKTVLRNRKHLKNITENNDEQTAKEAETQCKEQEKLLDDLVDIIQQKNVITKYLAKEQMAEIRAEASQIATNIHFRRKGYEHMLKKHNLIVPNDDDSVVDQDDEKDLEIA